MELGARSKSFETRLGKSSPSRTFFYWISENFVSQFSWNAGEMVFSGGSSQLERNYFGRANGNCVSRLQSFFEDFRELRAAGPRSPMFPEADLSPKCGAKVEHAVDVQ